MEPDGAAPQPHTRSSRRRASTRSTGLTVLQALSDPVRLEIVRQLAGCPARASSSAARSSYPVTKSTASHHFKILLAAGIVSEREQGTSKYMRLRRDELDERFPGLLDSVLRRDRLALGRARASSPCALLAPRRSPRAPRRSRPRRSASASASASAVRLGASSVRLRPRARPSRSASAPRPPSPPRPPRAPRPRPPRPRPPASAAAAAASGSARLLPGTPRLEDERRVDELEVDHLGAVAGRAARGARSASSRPAARRSAGRARRRACGRCPSSRGRPPPGGGRACRRAARG